MDINSPLADLRDIHLPDPISWWPLAPGWWILIGMGLLCLATAYIFLIQRQRAVVKRTALAELAAIRSRHSQQRDNLQTAKELSALLRRVCISVGTQQQSAALVGNAWLKHLDRIGHCNDFTEGPGRLLTEAPYRQQTDTDASELIDLCQRWLKKLPSRPRD